MPRREPVHRRELVATGRAVRAHEVDVDHALHDVGRRLLDCPVVAEPGVTDDDVETAERLARTTDEPRHVILASDVTRDRFRFPAVRADPLDCGGEHRGPPRTEHDVRARPRQMFRAREPDPR